MKLSNHYFLFALIFLCCNQLVYSQGTGLNFDEKAYNALTEIEKPLGFGDALPKSISLRRFAPKVAHQGQFGTCVGWSTTYYAATIEFARKKNIENKDEITAFAFDPYYTFLNITKETDYFSCSEGTLITNAAIHLTKKGVKRFLYNSLECGAKIDLTNRPQNTPLTFTDYNKVFVSSSAKEENIAAMKQSLSEGHPVVIGMALPKSFYGIDSSGLFKPELTEKQFVADYGGHAMAVIGYDDERFGGTFELINSWGEDWGDKGFAYVKYADFIDFTRMAVRFETELTDPRSDKDCIFGDCTNGYGQYVFEDGNTYEGNFVNGERVGYGIYFWKNDLTSFGGEWETSRRNGKGLFTSSKGIKQEGYWKNDVFVQGEIVINSYLNKQLNENISENLQYLSSKEISAVLQNKDLVDEIVAKLPIGCVYGDCINGNGLLLAANYIYFGTFESGLRHGYGEMRWTGESWGHVYIGNSESNIRHGIGAYFWSNGNKYYGEWKNGNREGIGTFFNDNGDIQAGKFVNNNFESEGLGFGATKIDAPLGDPKITSIDFEDKSTAVKTVEINKKSKKAKQ